VLLCDVVLVLRKSLPWRRCRLACLGTREDLLLHLAWFLLFHECLWRVDSCTLIVKADHRKFVLGQSLVDLGFHFMAGLLRIELKRWHWVNIYSFFLLWGLCNPAFLRESWWPRIDYISGFKVYTLASYVHQPFDWRLIMASIYRSGSHQTTNISKIWVMLLRIGALANVWIFFGFLNDIRQLDVFKLLMRGAWNASFCSDFLVSMPGVIDRFNGFAHLICFCVINPYFGSQFVYTKVIRAFLA